MLTGEMNPRGSKTPEDHLGIALLVVVVSQVAVTVQGDRKS